MFRVSKSWAKRYSVKGCWTAEQLAWLGISWPPPKGFVETLEGMLITETAAYQFEQLNARRKLEIELNAQHRAQLETEVYYTWPDGAGGFAGSTNKPPDFGERFGNVSGGEF